MGSEFLGPGGGQGVLAAVAQSLSAPGGMTRTRRQPLFADVPLTNALTAFLVNNSIVAPTHPSNAVYRVLGLGIVRVDATLADTCYLQIDFNGLFITAIDLTLAPGESRQVVLPVLGPLSSGAGVAVNMRGLCGIAGNVTVKATGSFASTQTVLFTLFTPGADI